MIEIAPGIHRAFVARERWVAAVEGFDGAAIAVEEAHVPGLEAVGMLLPDGSLAEPWVAPLLAVERAEAGATLLATQGEVLFSTQVSVGARDVVTAMHRARLRDGRVVAREPVAEVTWGPRSEAWTLLRRVLPPTPEFRTAPTDSPVAEPVVASSPIRPRDVASLSRWWVEVSDNPALEAAERASATVNAAITREGSDDATTLMWFADGEQLYRMDAAGAYRVGRGDVGAGLLAALT